MYNPKPYHILAAIAVCFLLPQIQCLTGLFSTLVPHLGSATLDAGMLSSLIIYQLQTKSRTVIAFPSSFTSDTTTSFAALIFGNLTTVSI